MRIHANTHCMQAVNAKPYRSRNCEYKPYTSRNCEYKLLTSHNCECKPYTSRNGQYLVAYAYGWRGEGRWWVGGRRGGGGGGGVGFKGGIRSLMPKVIKKWFHSVYSRMLKCT